MYIKLTRKDGFPIWLNASFVVTIEPAKNGGAIVVPIGDGLDYEVRETPEAVLALLNEAPAPAVVPVPPPKSLAPQPDDVSPDSGPVDAQVEEKNPGESEAPPPKPARRRKKAQKKEDAPVNKVSESASSAAAPFPKAPAEPEGFKEIVADLKARKCRTGKRLRNAIKSYFRKPDETEIDSIIEAMINGGYMLVGGDGHVTWIESPS